MFQCIKYLTVKKGVCLSIYSFISKFASLHKKITGKNPMFCLNDLGYFYQSLYISATKENLSFFVEAYFYVYRKWKRKPFFFKHRINCFVWCQYHRDNLNIWNILNPHNMSSVYQLLNSWHQILSRLRFIIIVFKREKHLIFEGLLVHIDLLSWKHWQHFSEFRNFTWSPGLKC